MNISISKIRNKTIMHARYDRRNIFLVNALSFHKNALDKFARAGGASNMHLYPRDYLMKFPVDSKTSYRITNPISTTQTNHYCIPKSMLENCVPHYSMA